jgi:hypothetical protein
MNLIDKNYQYQEVTPLLDEFSSLFVNNRITITIHVNSERRRFQGVILNPHGRSLTPPMEVFNKAIDVKASVELYNQKPVVMWTIWF